MKLPAESKEEWEKEESIYQKLVVFKVYSEQFNTSDPEILFLKSSEDQNRRGDESSFIYSINHWEIESI